MGGEARIAGEGRQIDKKLLIYGAYGYSGELIARLTIERGLRPILAGRNPEKLAKLADELDCEARAFQLQDRHIVEQRLQDVDVVLHCAGPFHRTFRPISQACLKSGTHYLDITGEVEVFESLAAWNDDWREADLMLMPGVGFDVVPSDCLAAHLQRLLPAADHLCLAIRALSRISRGTATTMIENLHRGGLVRRNGRLEKVPPAWKRRSVDFGAGEIRCVTVPWGDVSTAFHSTGIPNIDVFMALPARQRAFLRLTRYLRPVLASALTRNFLKSRIRARAPGPTPEQRARGRSWIWGEASAPGGARAASRLELPEGYTLTALTAVAVVERVLADDAPSGFQTPSKAYGSDFILEIPGVRRWDEESKGDSESSRT